MPRFLAGPDDKQLSPRPTLKCQKAARGDHRPAGPDDSSSRRGPQDSPRGPRRSSRVVGARSRWLCARTHARCALCFAVLFLVLLAVLFFFCSLFFSLFSLVFFHFFLVFHAGTPARHEIRHPASHENPYAKGSTVTPSVLAATIHLSGAPQPRRTKHAVSGRRSTPRGVSKS